jgi:hypothetical protein
MIKNSGMKLNLQINYRNINLDTIFESNYQKKTKDFDY